jgi:4-amino-4-deoxy-L-arabinose transferase-like glycosyltransferase
LYLSYHIFGIEPWAVRLPAFLAGMGLIPAIYSLGKRLYSKPTGLVAAALVAASPEVLQYSVTARGYTLLALLTILLLLLSLYVKNHRNRAAWLLWALTAALGFYTVPVFLYPFGTAVAWLFLALVVNDFQSYRGRLELLLHLIVSGMAAGVTTFLLYLPVFLHHRTFSVLFGNVFIVRLPWDAFRQTTPIRLLETWIAWINALPPLVVNILILGFGLALLLHWKLSNTRVPVQLAAVAWLVPLVLIQEVQLWAKTWFAFNPLVVLWCAAGLVGLVGILFQWIHLPKRLFPIVTGLAIVVILVGSVQYKQTNFRDMNRPGTNESIALYLKQNLQPEDTIMVSREDEPMVWYYLLLHQVPEKVFLVRSTSFKRAFVVVGPADDLTLPEVVAKGADPKYFDLEKADTVKKIGNSTIYLVPGR